MKKKELIESLKQAIETKDYKEIADRLLVQSDNHFFNMKFNSNANEKYESFILYMSRKFEINVKNIILTGSSRYGYSLNPNKDFRDFNEESDIDIVIISNKEFNIFWDILYENYMLGERSDEFKSAMHHTFKRFIDINYSDKILYSKYYTVWKERTEGYKKDLQLDYDFPDKISYRIYRNWEDYQTSMLLNVKRLKETIREDNSNESI